MIKEAIIKFAFNIKMERYAHMLKLDVNTENNSITAEILLRGECSPITVHIGHYEVLTGEESGLKISQIHTSREWMTEAIQELAPEHFIKLNYAKLLKIFL